MPYVDKVTVDNTTYDIRDTINANKIQNIESLLPHDGGAGAIVTVNGTADVPLAELVVYGKSTQASTPTPSAPVNIVTAGSSGTLPMVSTGKNLLIPPDLTTSYTHADITYSYDPTDGAIVLNGTASSISNLHFGAVSGPSSSNTQHIPNGSYVLSGGVSNNVYLTLYDGLDTTGTRYDDNGNTATMQIASGAIFNPRIVVRAGTVCDNLRVYPMIRPAAITDAAFAAYNGVTSDIPTPNGLPGIPVTSGGNYTDADGQQWICDTIDLEAGVCIKRCGVATLDGSENWYASASVAGRYYIDAAYTPNAVRYANHLCTHAVANPGSATSDTGKSYFASGANFNINTEYASVAAFKAALDTSNMALVYALATPVTTLLTEAQLTALRSLRGKTGITNIYSTDAGEPEIRAELYIDIPTYIDSIINGG